MALTPLLGFRIGYVAGEQYQVGDTLRPVSYLENLANVLLYQLLGDGIIQQANGHPVIDESTGRIEVPGADESIVGLIYGKAFVLTNAMEASGTADSGGTTHLVDAGLTQDANFWVDATVLFTSGDNEGEVRAVTSFSAGQLNWTAELGHAVAPGDSYTVTFFYINDLTNSALNYVYARSVYRTATQGIVQWVANTTGDKTAGDLLVATVTLDGSGVVTASDNHPDEADRNLFAGGGQVHELVLTGNLVGLEGSAVTSVTREHDELNLLGPITVETDDAEVTAAITDGLSPDELTVQFTNTGSYTKASVAYTITRRGRLRITP